MQILRHLSALAVALLISPAIAQNYDLPIREHVFENGLRLLVIERPGEQRVVSKIFTDMGALNETPGEFGAAHFLEHLMFKGTTTLGSTDWEREKGLHEQLRAAEDALIEELNRSRNDLRQRGVFHDYQHSETTPRIDDLRALIDSLNRQAQELSEEGPLSVWYMAYGGTGLTATTEQEYMKFDIDLPLDRVELFLRIEADRMQNSIFRNFDAERMVLVEQRLGDLNRAETEFREAMNSLVGRASMVYVPEGYANDFQQYTRRYERELYETYFVPNNTTLIFIGGVTLEDMMPQVEKYFGHMERLPEPKRYQGREPLPSAEKRLNWRSNTLAPRVEIRYQIPGVGHPDRPLFDVLAAAFEGHLQSVITEAGVEGTVDINTRVVHTSRFGVPASINIELVLEDALQIEKAEGALLAELRRLGKEPLPADLVLQARKQLRTEWYRTAVDPNTLAFQIGHFEVMDSWRTLEPYLEARDAATADDLRALAGKYFIANNQSVGVVLPEEVPQ
ncbi:putative Zn-dependent peptidase [uncultured Woeseiaceae bacterium]|uniref:Putative Zn-dependent peptidase n=1 Tax=uncultured Woeseiaceae bacterium TaxID=1983305 RepID=A0A7D9H6R3_9GAMM|nr:putative Zn-dependent peptidase [uncultured Woeseiaceae bacterium]